MVITRNEWRWSDVGKASVAKFSDVGDVADVVETEALALADSTSTGGGAITESQIPRTFDSRLLSPTKTSTAG